MPGKSAGSAARTCMLDPGLNPTRRGSQTPVVRAELFTPTMKGRHRVCADECPLTPTLSPSPFQLLRTRGWGEGSYVRFARQAGRCRGSWPTDEPLEAPMALGRRPFHRPAGPLSHGGTRARPVEAAPVDQGTNGSR